MNYPPQTAGIGIFRHAGLDPASSHSSLDSAFAGMTNTQQTSGVLDRE
jgi:hypothetical protein